MCGIAGEIRHDRAPADIAAVARMTEAMARRGPDAHGLRVQGNIAFGHRRLRVIDTSDAAEQPMVDPHLGLSIVYNGAIYNYRALRDELIGRGYRFYSQGDTELILKAYHAWGADAVNRFNGMFAFAIQERDSGRVFAARDRLGIKPFYYADTKGGLRFASTLPALLAGGGVDTRIDPTALNFYLSFHAVVPAPYTILKGVRKLPPGHTLTVHPNGRRSIDRYWELAFQPSRADTQRGAADWQEEVLAELRRAVERRLVADVPTGVLLSGGLDSSLITGLIHEIAGGPVRTFSIGFEGAGGEEGNEFRYSDVIAKHFQTDHARIVVKTGNLVERLNDCIGAMSEPMVSHDNVAFYLLSEEVSRHVKVVLSGQGADEVFAGYHWYPPMLGSNDPVADYARSFFDRDYADYKALVAPELLAGDAARDFVAAHFEAAQADRPIDKALHIDQTVMLPDDPVKRLDNMSMAHGLEARVPFIDHELVELAARIPAEHKIKGDGKYVLKEAARRVIPADVIDRPKGYFPVPALKHIEGPVLDYVRDVLSAPAARERGLFNKTAVDSFLGAPSDHITPLRGSKLWQVALLEAWLQTNHIGGSA